MSYKVSVVIEKDEDGFFAYSPELQGCVTQGNSYDEVIRNMREAVELYLEDMTDMDKKRLLSKEILTTNFLIDVS